MRKYAKPENLPKSAIDKKFLASLTPEQMITAEIVLMTQDIDKVAETLDNIKRRVNNSSVFMILSTLYCVFLGFLIKLSYL